jgi:hypothetical protein
MIELYKKDFSIKNDKIEKDIEEKIIFKNKKGKYYKYEYGNLVEKHKLIKKDFDNYVHKFFPNKFVTMDIFKKAYDIVNNIDNNEPDTDNNEHNTDNNEHNIDNNEHDIDSYSDNTINYTKNIIKPEYKMTKKKKKCKSIENKYGISNQQGLKKIYTNYNPMKNKESKDSWLKFNEDYDYYNNPKNFCFK